jgi:uncharacterized protein DUF6573
VPEGVRCQDGAGRLWGVLWMMRLAIQRRSTSLVLFELFVRDHNRDRLDRRDLVRLKVVCGPGDDLAPCITIMLPEEDR